MAQEDRRRPRATSSVRDLILGGEAAVPGRAPPEIDAAVVSLVAALPSAGWDMGPVREILREGVSAALARRDVPEDAICWPRPDVLAPAAEALRYSMLRDEFANLIAASMDRRVAFSVLPAYVEVLKQLSPDEMGLLRAAPELGRVLPAGDLVYIAPTGQVITAHRHIVPAAIAGVCAHRRNIPQYVDNLLRLNLLSRPAGQTAGEAAYRDLAKPVFVRDLIRAAPPKSRAQLDRAVMGVTDFGDHFRRACLL